MKSLVRFLGNSALDTLKDISNAMNDAINSFDLDKFDDMLENAQKSLNTNIKKLSERFKDTPNSFVVNIPYNRETDERLVTKIEGNHFVATVETITSTEKNGETVNSTSTKETSVYLPDDVDIHTEKRHYDGKQHRMFFHFDKKKSE